MEERQRVWGIGFESWLCHRVALSKLLRHCILKCVLWHKENKICGYYLEDVGVTCGFRGNLQRLSTSFHMLPKANPQTSAGSDPPLCKYPFPRDQWPITEKLRTLGSTEKMVLEHRFALILAQQCLVLDKVRGQEAGCCYVKLHSNPTKPCSCHTVCLHNARLSLQCRLRNYSKMTMIVNTQWESAPCGYCSV